MEFKENSPANSICSAIDTVCLEGPSEIKGSFWTVFPKPSVSMAGIWEQGSVPLRLGFLSQKPTRRPVPSLYWGTAPEALRDSQCEQVQVL